MRKNKWSKALGAAWLLIGISLLLASCQTTCKNDSLDFDSEVPEKILTQYASDLEKEGLSVKDCSAKVYCTDLLGALYGSDSTQAILQKIEQEEPLYVEYLFTFENGSCRMFAPFFDDLDEYVDFRLPQLYYEDMQDVVTNYGSYFARSSCANVPSDVTAEKVYITYSRNRGVCAYLMTDKGNFLCIKSLFEDGDTVLIPENDFQAFWNAVDCQCYSGLPYWTQLFGHDYLISHMNLTPYVLEATN